MLQAERSPGRKFKGGNAMQDISMKLAKFAVETRTEDIPEDVMAVQKKSIMEI